MSTLLQTKTKATATSSLTPAPTRLLQRKCACGGAPGVDGECAECRAKRLARQSSTTGQSSPTTVPTIVHDALNSPGQPLDTGTRTFMEPRFGHDFSQVRVHTDARAAESARSVNASAYTVGRDIVFGTARYEPGTMEGKRLLAHELTHVVQQSAAIQRSIQQKGVQESGSIQSEQFELQARDVARQVIDNASVTTPISSIGSSSHLQREQLGTRVTHTQSSSPFRHIAATFDGQDFKLMGDGRVILQASAQSGRPIKVRSAEARKCGGSTDDTYMNNPRYVGIADNGPIPEGEYQFRATEMATFSFAERMKMLPGGDYTDPFGRSLHGGDWGAGRVALNPVRILPSRFCGNPRTRSGFYLHGGILAGSSGCIDVGNSSYSSVVELLNGYRNPVHVSVSYTHAPPEVGFFGRAVGRFTYPRTGGHNPSILDRLGSLFGGDED